MKYQDLDQLFSAARNVELETSATEIASWVGASAASSTGVLGVAAKLKLFIAKKSFIMLGITLGSVGLVAVTTSMLGSTSTEEKVNKPVIVSELTEDKQSEVKDAYVFDNEDTLEVEAPGAVFPVPPAPPTPPAPAAFPSKPEKPSAPETPAKPTKPGKPVYAAKPKPPRNPRREIAYAVPKEPDTKAKIQVHARDGKTGKPCHVSVCHSDKKCPKVEGNGEVIKQDRDVSSFTELEISGLFDVIITQGTTEKVSVETDSNLQEYVIVKNDGSKLILENGSANFKKITKMKVYVTVKDLKKITTEGLGDITSESKIKSSDLTIKSSNVGDVELDLECDKLTVKSNGVGDVKLSGTCKNANVNNSGVGDFNAYKLNTQTMEIEHSGVGDAQITVTEDLNVDFSGVGSVFFKGNPKKKEIKKEGVGSVKSKS